MEEEIKRDFQRLNIPTLTQVIILSHRHGDVDAYCASYALGSFVRRLSRKAIIEIASPQGFGLLTQRVIEEYPSNVVKKADLGRAGVVFVVDTGNLALLEDWGEDLLRTTAKKVFIDHHPLSDSVRSLADYLVIDDRASSACEVIYKIFQAFGVKVSQNVAQVLLTGILFDSQHLSIARNPTFMVVAQLLEKGADIDTSRKLLAHARETPEVIARLKAAQRLKFYRAGEWFVATTTVGSYHASVARMLVEVGADMGVALGDGNEVMRCSLRSNQRFYKKAGVHLGLDIAEKVSKILNSGAGGGHPTAASISITTTPDQLEKLVLELVSKALNVELEKVI